MSADTLAIDGGAPVREDFLVFGAPLILDEEIDEVVAVLRSGWLGTGPRVARFEEAFRGYVGTKHAKAVASCTAALHLSMLVAGVKPGDEVITTPLTFAATSNAVVHCGATPVFADVDRRTMNIDPAAVERAVTPRTRALIVVHLAGRPCEMGPLREIAREKGLALIEDAAHAIEARTPEGKVGALGDMGCFSFYVTKNVITAEGGMVTTERDDWAERVEAFALHGLSRGAWRRFTEREFRHYEVVEPGFKYNMTDLQAALGIHQLARVEENHARREALWRRYDEGLAGLPLILPAGVPEGWRHARHLYTPLLDLERLTVDRDRFVAALQAEGVGTGIHYRSVHLHHWYRKTFDFRPEDFPEAWWVSERTLSIPLGPALGDADAEDVIAAVRKVAAAYSR